jgi:D-serine deaminase-like pyridoxal phosphate-dependent protein
MHLNDLRTPAVLVEAGRARANIARMQALASSNGRRLRPHAKTHKSPAIAAWQLKAGAAGVCCAKLGEAEVFADAGIRDIRLPYPIHPSNAGRVIAQLDRGVRLSIIVDLTEIARDWSAAMRAAGRTLDVLVKVDVGFHRCGIDPYRPDAADFIAEVSTLPGLRLAGLLSHAGHAYQATSDAELRAIAVEEASLLHQMADAVRARGVAVEELSVGATPTVRFSATMPGLTELRPGNYVYFDRTQVALGAATLDDCALTVLSTVVTMHKDRAILDAGSKTLSSDPFRSGPAARPSGFGAVFSDVESAAQLDDALFIERLSEEHATVRVTGTTRLRPGDRVRILPNHACVVSNLVDEVALVEGTRVVDRLPVAARGRIA